VRSLSEAEDASRLDPALAEPRFYKALALEKMHLTQGAIDAWEEYLLTDPSSRWADEARAHLGSLRSPRASSSWEEDRPRLLAAAASAEDGVVVEIARRHLEPALDWTQGELLGVWADAQLAGDSAESSRALQIANRVGTAVADAAGDRLIPGALAAIHAARHDSQRMRVLAEAHRDFRSGKAKYVHFEADSARKLLSVAAEEFARGGSPFKPWAEFYAAVGDYQGGRVAESQTIFSRLRNAPSAADAPVLQGRVLWMIGQVASLQGRPETSIAPTRQAAEILGRAGMKEDEIFLRFNLAGSYEALGERRAEWGTRVDGFALLGQLHDLRRVQTALMAAGVAAWKQGRAGAALRFLENSVGAARRQPEPAIMANAYVWLAVVRYRLGQLAPADEALEAARSWVSRCPDPGFKRRLQAEVDSARGQVHASDRPEEAARDLTSALSYFREIGAHSRVAEILAARAGSHRAASDSIASEADLLSAIESVESERNDVNQEPARISFFDVSRDLFGEMIRLQLAERKDPARGLQFAERGRARALGERLQARGWRLPVLSPSELAASMRRDTAVIEYSVLSDRVAGWVLGSGGVRAFEVTIGPDAVRRDVEEFANLLSGHAGADEIRGRGARLYALLIAPIADSVRGLRRLVFVPDGSLHAVPFACLVDSSTGRWLIQDFEVAVAPSAALALLASTRSDDSAPRAPAQALVVGSPRFDSRVFPSLPDLPGAGREAERIGSMYEGSTILSGASATKSRILASAGAVTVFHYAGHAMENVDDPAMARLVTAADEAAGDPGILLAKEIDERGFPKARLVVLAGCGTGAGRISSEGVLSLARPFMASGVPDVVVSLWPLEDRGALELSIRFHEGWLSGRDAAGALRDAQIHLIESADPELSSPATWGAFQLVGLGAAERV